MTKPVPIPPQKPPIRVLIVDDHEVIREGLRIAIEEEADLCVIAEAGTWREAFSLVTSLKPDVLVLDLKLPDGNGWSLVEQLREKEALPPTLVFSICDEQVYAPRLLRAGARGYLMKNESLERIVAAIRQVYAGHRVASPGVTSQLMNQALSVAEASVNTAGLPEANLLSDRELQIFTLLGQGLRNKEIAVQMDLNEKSVATYKLRLMEKLGVSTTAELLGRYREWQEGTGDR